MRVEFIGGGCRDGLRMELGEPLSPRRYFPVPARLNACMWDGSADMSAPVMRDVYLLERPVDSAPRYRWIAREG